MNNITIIYICIILSVAVLICFAISAILKRMIDNNDLSSQMSIPLEDQAKLDKNKFVVVDDHNIIINSSKITNQNLINYLSEILDKASFIENGIVSKKYKEIEYIKANSYYSALLSCIEDLKAQVVESSYTIISTSDPSKTNDAEPVDNSNIIFHFISTCSIIKKDVDNVNSQFIFEDNKNRINLQLKHLLLDFLFLTECNIAKDQNQEDHQESLLNY